MTQLIDFSPLSRIGDTYLKALEAQRDREEGAALVAQMERMGGGAPAGGGNVQSPAAVSSTPARPPSMGQTMASGPTRMAMPPEAFAPLIKQAAAQHGVDEGMLTRQLAQESSFNPNAVSRAGAEGVAQFMPATAQRFGIDPRNPAQAIPAAARYVAENRRLLGNDGLALAGYNWGEGNVQKWLANGADPRAVPGETRDYVQKITGRPIEAWAQAGRQGTNGTATPTATTATATAPGAGGMPGSTNGLGQALQDPTTRELLASQLRRRDTRGAAVMKLVELRNKGDNFSVVDVGDGRKARMRGSDGQIDMLPDQDTPEQKHARALEIAKAGKAETNINTATNPLFDALGERYKTAMKSAGSARDAIYSTFEARRALEDGAIAGALADQRLLGAKLFELFGVGDGSAQKTEVLRSMLGDNVLANINKLGSQPSSSDRVYSEKVKAGSIALEEGSIRTLVEIQEKAARKAIQNFNYMGAKVLADPKIREKMGEYSGLMVEDEPETYEQWLQTNGRRPAPGAASPQALRGASAVVGPPGPPAPQGTVFGRFPWSLKATTPVQQPGSL